MPDKERGRPIGTAPHPDHGQEVCHDSSPYAQAWGEYVAAGWSGPIPIATSWRGRPSDGKFPPASGVTGRRNYGTWPTLDQMREWAAQPSAWSNIALRLLDDVIGLDVDAYGDKRGAATMAQLVDRYGPLPATWTSTSRGADSSSRIHWFRVPAGLKWPGKLPGGDVEIIQHAHRYAIVWPSIHPSGRQYQWFGPSGELADRIPTPDELAPLPAAHVAALTAGKVVDHKPHQVQQRGGVVCDEMMGDARSWLTAGQPCQAVVRALDGFDGTSRHDSMLALQVKLLRLGEQGHRGVLATLDTLESMFVDSVTADGSRDSALAEDEWQRALNQAPAQLHGRTPKERRGCCPVPPPTLDELAARYGIVRDADALVEVTA